MLETKNLILIGGGGHCKSVICVAESAGYNILGILDLPEKVGEKVLGYTILGTDDHIPDYVSNALFLVTVGQIRDAETRIRIQKKIESFGGRLATLIAPSAVVSRHSEIGEGTVIMHHTMVNSDAKIGKGCIVNTFANIGHDVEVGDFCHVSTGAKLNGNCIIGQKTFIGSQAALVNGISIADECLIAAGAIVIKSIYQKGLYAGNPAVLKKTDFHASK